MHGSANAMLSEDELGLIGDDEAFERVMEKIIAEAIAKYGRRSSSKSSKAGRSDRLSRVPANKAARTDALQDADASRTYDVAAPSDCQLEEVSSEPKWVSTDTLLNSSNDACGGAFHESEFLTEVC